MAAAPTMPAAYGAAPLGAGPAAYPGAAGPVAHDYGSAVAGTVNYQPTAAAAQPQPTFGARPAPFAGVAGVVGGGGGGGGGAGAAGGAAGMASPMGAQAGFAQAGGFTTTETATQPSFMQRLVRSLQRQMQTVLDRSTPHLVPRWLLLAALLTFYLVRVFRLQGFYIVTYGLGIYLLHLLIAFLAPQDVDVDGAPLLPTDTRDEFKPFERRLPEFKFWLAIGGAALSVAV
jgi:hypothetical protein